MSEIFEALRKAQRQADRKRGPEPEQAADTAAAEPTPFTRVEEARRAMPAAPARPHRTVQRRRWWRRWMRGNSRNGAAPEAKERLLTHEFGTAISEQFRLLRTRVETVGPGTFMVTSALDKEGKTLCATNLAETLALSLAAGVILVDADLRHPSVGRWFGMTGGSPGLVDCLLGEARWQDCLRDGDQERLRLLPAGRSSSKSTELLGCEQMPKLLQEMKAAFPRHYIVVDAPPLLLTADPLVLARHVDHVLLVVRAAVTPRGAVDKAIDMLGADRFLGIVFNGAVQHASHYYYYGRYPYGEGQ